MATKLGGIIIVVHLLLCKHLLSTEIEDYRYKCTGCYSLLDASVCLNCSYVDITDENISLDFALNDSMKDGNISLGVVLTNSITDSSPETIVGSVIGGTLFGVIISTLVFFCARSSEQRKRERVLHNLQNPAYEQGDDVQTHNDLDQEKKKIALYSEINDEMLYPQTVSSATGKTDQQNITEQLSTAGETHVYNHLNEIDKLRRDHLQNKVAMLEPCSSELTDEKSIMSFKATEIENSSGKVGTDEKVDTEKENKSTGQYYVLEKTTQLST